MIVERKDRIRIRIQNLMISKEDREMIDLLRVDYRLLHGQVAFSWTQALGANAILLVSDTVRDSPVRMNALKMAKPVGTKVVLKNTKEAIDVLNSGVTDKYNLFIICEDVFSAKKILENTSIKQLNIGNIAFAEGKRKLSNAIYIDDNEEKILKELIQDGKEVFVQMVPSDKKVDINKLI